MTARRCSRQFLHKQNSLLKVRSTWKKFTASDKYSIVAAGAPFCTHRHTLFNIYRCFLQMLNKTLWLCQRIQLLDGVFFFLVRFNCCRNVGAFFFVCSNFTFQSCKFCRQCSQILLLCVMSNEKRPSLNTKYFELQRKHFFFFFSALQLTFARTNLSMEFSKDYFASEVQQKANKE